MRSSSIVLNIKWRQKTFSLKVDEDTTVAEVLRELEKQSHVPRSKMKFSPNVLPVNSPEAYLYDHKFFAQCKKDAVRVLMIGTPTEQASGAPAAPVEHKKPPQKAVKHSAPAKELSAAYVDYQGQLEGIRGGVQKIEGEMHAQKAAVGEQKEKLRLVWTERLMQVQLKLDALCLPEVEHEERLALRKQRKEVILYAEKLILDAEKLR